MLTTVNPIDAVAFGRLMEFLSPDPPWNRSLWSIGLVLGMQELCEASIMLQTGTLSEASVKRICSSLQLKMGKDPALSVAEKLHLRQQIGHPPKVGGPAHHTVAQMANALNTDYLRRWAGIAGKGEHTVEMFARSVASHVLDAGFSAQHVRQLLKAKASGPDPITLAEICEELHGMQTSNPIRPFEVLLAFHRPPKLTHGLPSNWLEAEEVTGLFDELIQNYLEDTHGIEIARFGEKYRFLSKASVREYAKRLFQISKISTLSGAALETLAIIAYRQPVTRVEIEEIRGVGADMMLRKLQARNLIREDGRSDAPGRPILYSVTDAFMDAFQLYSLDELPELPTFDEDREGNDELFNS